jgi:hypothetical protein
VAVRARPAQPRYGWNVELKLLLFVGGLMITVIVVVLFVPGVQDYIEGYVLSWLARLAG